MAMNAETSVRSFTEQFANARSGLPGGALPWLAQMREKALDRFASTGLPTRKVEAWKYTDLRALHEIGFSLINDPSPARNIDVIPSVVPAKGINTRLVFVDGRFREDISTGINTHDGVVLGSLGAMLERDPCALRQNLGRIDVSDGQPLTALNTAFMADGFIVRVSPGVRAEVPIEIVFVGGLVDRPIAYHPRNLILVEEGGAATVVEHHVGVGVGAGAYFANGVTEIRVAERGHLRHYIGQAESREAIHLATAHVDVARDATYEAFTLSTGSRLARNEASVRLMGEGAHCGVSGAYLMRERQHCDNTILIEHQVPRTSCREVFKGVLDDQARAVFQGKIVVRREAQKTDGHQVSKALLLSDGAEIDMKPELEICADDVKCSHGAAAGELDHDPLFYLRSRGVPEPLARGLLVEAFIEEAFEEMSCEDLRATLMANVSSWLALGQKEGA